MKIYLAHNFDARDRLKLVVMPMFSKEGHTITSSWIWDDSHKLGGIEQNQQSAQRDIEDIQEADTIVFFLDQFSTKPGKGKFFEWGYAQGIKKFVYLIGKDKSCIFFHLQGGQKHFESIEECLIHMRGSFVK